MNFQYFTCFVTQSPITIPSHLFFENLLHPEIHQLVLPYASNPSFLLSLPIGNPFTNGNEPLRFFLLIG